MLLLRAKHKLLIFGLIISIILIGKIDISLGELAEINAYQGEENIRPQLGENQNVANKVVPYIALEEKGAYYPVENSSHVLETVAGLKDAGYSLDEIVLILKNNDTSALTISSACLNNGYKGEMVFGALTRAGFGEREVQTAVPFNMRQVNVLAEPYNPALISAGGVVIETNPFIAVSHTQDVVSGDKSAYDNVAPVELEVSVGVSFDGLGDWRKFQNQRFESIRR